MLEIFLQNSIKSGLKISENRRKSFLNFDAIKNVLILFDICDWNLILPIYEDLKKNGKNVICWTILPKHGNKNSSQRALPKEVKIVDLRKDTDWRRVIRSEILSEFDQLQYDTLLDLSSEDSDHMISLKVRNKGLFYLSFKKLDYPIYDFVILRDKEKSIWDTYKEMKIYLSHIQ